MDLWKILRKEISDNLLIFPGKFHQGLDPLFALLGVSPQKSLSHKRAYASVVIAITLGDIGASDGVILDNDVGMAGTGKVERFWIVKSLRY